MEEGAGSRESEAMGKDIPPRLFERLIGGLLVFLMTMAFLVGIWVLFFKALIGLGKK